MIAEYFTAEELEELELATNIFCSFLVKAQDQKKSQSIDNIDNTEGLERITITIPRSMKYALDDLMLDRKRNKKPNRTASAMIREALEVYFKNNNY